MINKELWQKNLEFNTSLVEKLEPYSDRKVSELPDNLKIQLQRIKIGPKITTSGLESVYSILGELYLINASLRQAISDPEGFMKMYGRQQRETEDRRQKTEDRRQETEIKRPATSDQQSAEKITNEPINRRTNEQKKVIEPKITIKPTVPATNPSNKAKPRRITKLLYGAKLTTGQSQQQTTSNQQPLSNNESPPPASQIDL